jgi:maltose alpha-D-glucosyltransferase/alpha-amylase
VAVHNFGAEAVEFRLPVKGAELLSELLEDGTTKVAKDGTAKVSLEPYGYRWFRVVA